MPRTKLYHDMKEQGRCGNCGKAKECSSLAYCSKCLEKYREDNTTKYKECQSRGLCNWCKSPLDGESKLYCIECRKKKSAQALESYHRNKMKGRK